MLSVRASEKSAGNGLTDDWRDETSRIVGNTTLGSCVSESAGPMDADEKGRARMHWHAFRHTYSCAPSTSLKDQASTSSATWRFRQAVGMDWSDQLR